MSTEIEQQEELQNRQLEESILQMAGHNEYARLARKLEGMNPAAAALTLEVLPPEKQIMAFRSLPKDSAAAIFTFLDSELRLHIVKYFSESTNKSLREDIQRMVAEMPADDAADFIEEMKEGEFPANLVEAILSSINQARRDEINDILKYPDGSAGSIMTLEYIMLREDLTLGEAMAQIRQQGMRKETIYNCYAVADGRRIVGAVSLKDIILGGPTLKIRDIMKTPVIYAHTQDDQETVAQKVKDYDLLAIPVVDNDTRLVGIITVDDIMDVVEEENTEDFEKMAMLRPAEDEYLKTNVLEMARNRIFWLLLLMVSATLTGAIIMRFSHVLAAQVVLASFIPMLMDLGGNCGAQSSTLIIRGMAVGEIELSDWLQVIWKELCVGGMVAAALCLVNWLRMLLFVPELPARANLAVNATLFLTVCFSKLLGAALPMLARKAGRDPAMVSSPLLTTVIDSISLLTYFWIASMLLPG